MKKIILIIVLIFFLTQLLIAQKHSPMYYKGVDAGMSPKEVIEKLGKPGKIIMKDTYVYLIKGGGIFILDFFGGKHLFKIIIKYPTSIPYNEFGLSDENDNGFDTFIDDDGRKTWVKFIKSKEFGEITILYKSEAGYLNLINYKEMYISDNEFLSKWIFE